MTDVIELEVTDRDAEIKLAMELPLDELKVMALAWLNDLRAEYGVKAVEALPQGYRFDPGACTLALGLVPISNGGSYGTGSRYRDGPGQATFMRDGQKVARQIPPYIEAFVKHFDRGDYPELIKSHMPPGCVTLT